ncbi:MAG: hypothetical protein HUU47_06080 [Bacteroidetes bacterium]|nr:hypothetical protein [Bacteroidota bacterium]
MKNHKFFTLCVMLFCFLSVYSQKYWTKLKNVPGINRNSAICFGINDKIYLGLGQDSSGKKMNDFYEYDIYKKTWTQKGNFPGNGLFAPSSFVVKGRGYVCFGASNSGVAQKEVWEYNPSNDSWTKKNNFPGTARYGVSWFLLNDTAYLITGSTGGSPYLSEVYMYVAASDVWVKKNNFSGGSRSHGAGFTVNNVGYFGTGISNSTTPTKDVWKYNVKSDNWTQVKNYPVSITGAIAFELNGKGYLGTGYDLTKFSKDIYEYNDTTDTWKKLDSIPNTMSVRGGSVAFSYQNTVYLGTGYGVSTSKSLNDFWEFKIEKPCNAKIITQPKNQFGIILSSVDFTVGVIDTPTNFKWQVDDGKGFKDISDKDQYSGAFTSKLTIKNLIYSNNNLKFRCITSNTICNDTSKTALLQIVCKDIFLKQPKDTNVFLGNDASFNIKPLNYNVKLNWQIHNGTKFENLSNTGQYFGYNADTLKIFNVDLGNNLQKFRCIGNLFGCIDSTSNSTLYVHCVPILKTNIAKNLSVYKTNSIKFGVASYFKETTYQWQTDLGNGFKDLFNAGQYSGADTDSLTVLNTNWSNDNQKFRCVLKYKGCYDTSIVGTLNILCLKLIKTQPNDQNTKDGEPAYFRVIVSENNSTYKWQINNGLGMIDVTNSGQFSGAEKDTLKIGKVSMSNHRNYFRCIVSSDGCNDTSKQAILNVSCFSIINKQPEGKFGLIGNNIYLSVSSSKPNSSYKWQSNLGFGFININNAGQYSGALKDTLFISNLSSANNNQLFRCIVGYGSCLDTSQVVVVNSSCGSLIEAQPQNKTIFKNSNTYLSVKPSTSNCSFTWQSNIGFGYTNLSNAGQYLGVDKDTLFISNVNSNNDNQLFRCILKKGECIDTTGFVILTIKNGSIEIVKQRDEFIIFPNPGNEFINIYKSKIININQIVIFDEIGRKILIKDLINSNTKINIEYLPNGIYNIQTSPKLKNIKFIKY